MADFTKGFAAIIATVLSLHGVGALAGAADVKTSEGERMKFEYRGDLVRIGMGEQGNYMLLRDDKVYVVSRSDGQTMVVDLSQTMNMFGSMADAASPSTVEGKLLSLDSTGRSETVAGIQGEVYKARFIDHDGEKRSSEMVLAKDRRAREFQRAIFTMTNNMAKAANKEVEGAREVQKKLKAMDKGTLRFGEDMRVTAISDRTIDKSRFVLPAEPTDLSAMQGVFGGGGGGDEGESGGGFMSGIFGSKAQRQQDRVEDKTEREVDEQTDEITDTAVEKVFDKLFGR